MHFTWSTICKIMNDNLVACKKIIEEDMLVSEWPGTLGIWESGSSACFTRFTFNIRGKQHFNIILDTSYSPLPWPAMPALLQIAKDNCVVNRDNKGNAEYYKLEKYEEEAIATSLPFIICWNDWATKDDISFKCCPSKEWDDEMEFKTDHLMKYLEYLKETHDDFQVYMALIDEDEMSFDFKPIIRNEPGTLRDNVKKKVNENFIPLIIQICRTENGKCVVCYWMFKDENNYNEEI